MKINVIMIRGIFNDFYHIIINYYIKSYFSSSSYAFFCFLVCDII